MVNYASPSGRSVYIPLTRAAATIPFLVAASNASEQVRARADFLCDGVADNVQIQQAIDALPAGGGKVQLSEGTCTIAAPIRLRNGTVLQGQGRSSYNPTTGSIIFVANNAKIGAIHLKDVEVTHFELLDFTIDGNKVNQGTLGSTTLNGAIDAVVTSLVVTATTNFPTTVPFVIDIDSETLIVTAIAGTTFTVVRAARRSTAATHANLATVTLSAPMGIYIDYVGTTIVNSAKNLIEHVTIANCAGDGMEIYTPVGMNGGFGAVHDCIAWSNDGRGFRVQGADMFWAHCNSHRNGSWGWRIISGGAAGQYVNCRASQNGQVSVANGAGFYVSGANICMFTDCWSGENLGVGFRIGSADHMFTGCVAIENGTTAARKAGFHVEAGGDYAQFIGCNARDEQIGDSREQNYGLLIDAGATDVHWVGGKFYGNWGSTGNARDGAYSDAGTRTQIRDAVIIEIDTTGGVVTPGMTEERGVTSVADGGTIAHNLGKAPTRVICTATIAGEFVSVTALAATTFTVAIKKHDGTVGTTANVYWQAFR